MGIRDASKSYILFAIIHFFQFVLGVTVCGLYGVELDRARKADKYADGKWVWKLSEPSTDKNPRICLLLTRNSFVIRSTP